MAVCAYDMKSVMEQRLFHEFAFDNRALKTFVELWICWKRLKFEYYRIWITTFVTCSRLFQELTCMRNRHFTTLRNGGHSSSPSGVFGDSWVGEVLMPKMDEVDSLYIRFIRVADTSQNLTEPSSWLCNTCSLDLPQHEMWTHLM